LRCESRGLLVRLHLFDEERVSTEPPVTHTQCIDLGREELDVLAVNESELPLVEPSELGATLLESLDFPLEHSRHRRTSCSA